MKLWQKRITSRSLLPLGLKLDAALAAAHRQAGQRILEGLLEGEELEHAFGDAGVKADAALVGADGIVVLDPPAALDADVALVVLPAHAERDDAVGLGDAAQDLLAVIGFLLLDEVEDVLGDFLDRLAEFGLARVAALDPLDEGREVDVIGRCHAVAPFRRWLDRRSLRHGVGAATRA